MSKNIILRPVFNRPEMLQLSIEYEIRARKKSGIKDHEFLTLFLIEYGALHKTRQIVKSYPFPAKYVFRKREYESIDILKLVKNQKLYFRYGLSRNLMEGMKEAFTLSDDYVLIIEDDILIHETYFHYLKTLLAISEVYPYSSISASKHGMFSWSAKTAELNNSGDLSIVRQGHDYSPWASVISKWFFDNYVLPYANENYYENREKVVLAINDKYKELNQKGYKYTDNKHIEQAGLINRLVDVAMIKDNAFVLTPDVDRQMHIGYYGANRGRNKIKGWGFKQRVETLRKIIDNKQLYDNAKRKHHKDYRYFNDNLNSWNGILKLVE